MRRLSAIGHRLSARAMLVAYTLLVLPMADSRGPIAAQTPEEIVQQMRPPSGIEPAPEPWWADWPTWAMLAGLGLLAAAAGGAIALKIAGRRQAAKPASLTPQAWALRELARVESKPPAVDTRFDAYHTELSSIIRRYLEHRYQLKATKQTTPEFLGDMRSAKCLSPDQQALLRDFLERCDVVKFGGVRSTVAQCLELTAAARRFVQQTGAG